MKISSIFDKSVKYFGNYIMPKCEYCEFGNRSKENSKVLCSKNGLVPPDYSCNKFVHSPLKRVPVKQLNIEEED